ncbi:MAG: hypothetical protein E4H08_06080 [Candidatus Atribacteria bacterium]|jgi:hypothetical protein|nr:MAG: hypothetical protein E4H08_06080 [Candidatus Atribacteria bacterium]
MRMRGTTVDYEALLASRPSFIYDEVVRYLYGELPPLWQKAYRKMTQSPTSIHHFTHYGFDFFFDRASELHSRGVVPGERLVEDRIIVAYGQSTSDVRRTGNGSKHHLLGAAAERFGDNAQRPYMPGCVLGGTFDVSLYPQYRDLENEHSADSRTYRAMKKYCSDRPDTFCFTRLIYTSRSWRPTVFEHGLLRADGSFWVQAFKNAPQESRVPTLLRNVRVGRKASTELPFAD